VTALVEVTHFADAACPWDYSAEPVRIALEERYGAQLRWRTVQVGLHESGATLAARGLTSERLREAYRDFQRRLGMPFCSALRPRLHGSWPAARMIKAAEMQSPAAAAALLRRLRLAWFVEVRPMDKREALLALAAELDGIDVGRLRVDFAGEASLRAFRRDMALARRPDRTALALGKTVRPAGEPGPRFSTPTYVLRAAGRTATVPGFQPLEAYEVALHNLAPGLDRRPAPGLAAFFERRAGQLHAAVEVAAATARTPQEAIAGMDELGKHGRVRRLDIGGDGTLWCAGAPAIELRCPSVRSAPEPVAEDLAA
jgi:predicted DsbA family dithiol-disulfide isomerase